ncbi:hypothetical protein CMV30_18425 [Nibricoccus aquaticus]|uniref:Uncharacterized protein n=1 Tax=Nibricoccus aquaticus TaxID=2576891 RepID=A0A290QAN8_9BACT|nr:hypothetical protein CMV30_18425 [Nibricoccus aquaticus]
MFDGNKHPQPFPQQSFRRKHTYRRSPKATSVSATIPIPIKSQTMPAHPARLLLAGNSPHRAMPPRAFPPLPAVAFPLPQ